MDKRSYYIDPQVVANYESLRYSGFGGEYVNSRECQNALDLLPTNGKVLDLPCGTGRLSRLLSKRKQTTIAADYSWPMLTSSQKSSSASAYARTDAFQLPFADSCFDAVASLRFVFHCQNLGPLFTEIARVVKRGGIFVFDTYTWSPFMIPGTPLSLGGQTYIHTQRKIEDAAKASGFTIEKRNGAFLFSPLIYRYLPKLLIQGLDKLESLLPTPYRNVSFWQLRRN